MFDTWWFQETASGLFHAAWTEIWHQGIGVGLILLFGILAFVLKNKWCAGAAVVCAIGLFIYNIGYHDKGVVCTAQIKKIYLQAHPKITKKNIAPNWQVSPTWNPAAPPHYTPHQCNGPYDTTCWGQY